MDLGLHGKKALVTGASSGIGRATALALAAEGVSVALVARRATLLDEVVGAIRHDGGIAFAFAADIIDPAAPAAIMRVRAAGRVGHSGEQRGWFPVRIDHRSQR